MSGEQGRRRDLAVAERGEGDDRVVEAVQVHLHVGQHPQGRIETQRPIRPIDAAEKEDDGNDEIERHGRDDDSRRALPVGTEHIDEFRPEAAPGKPRHQHAPHLHLAAEESPSLFEAPGAVVGPSQDAVDLLRFLEGRLRLVRTALALCLVGLCLVDAGTAPLDPFQARAVEVGAEQVDPGHHRLVEVGTGQVRLRQIGSGEVQIVEAGALQRCLEQVGPAQVTTRFHAQPQTLQTA